MSELDGQEFVIVGGSSGIGLATARQVLGGGGTVTIAGRSRDKLASAAATLEGGDAVRSFSLDMTREDDVRDFTRSLGSESVDGLVISASSVIQGAFKDVATDDVRATIESKLLGPYVVAREMLPALRDGGSITFFSGVLSRRPGSSATALASINAAVEGLTRALAKELAPRLRVNCISPGMTRSDAYAAMSEERRGAMFTVAAKGLPAGRVAEADEIARAVLFAATQPFMTGHVLDVDGGHLIA